MGNTAAKPEVSEPRAEAVRRVLLVDDNVAGAQTMKILLEMEGIEVTVASTGEAALKAYDSLRPCLVLLDIGLPDVDGCDLARRILSSCGVEKPVMIAISGWGDEVTRARAVDAGVDYFFSKPVKFEELESVVLDQINQPVLD